MTIKVLETPEMLGEAAAMLAEEKINEAIKEKGKARIILATGRSQFEFLEAFVKKSIDFSKVEMFHLDEYIGLPITHKASFRKYLTERFVDIVKPAKVFFVDGEGDYRAKLDKLNEEISREPIDVAFVGIGENGHLAFNDPPADFDTEAPYIVVNLDDNCKKQQVREGWFKTENDVPKQAISMSIKQIMKSKTIICSVPFKVKAKAVYNTMKKEISNMFPASIMRNHSDCYMFLDKDSASLL